MTRSSKYKQLSHIESSLNYVVVERKGFVWSIDFAASVATVVEDSMVCEVPRVLEKALGVNIALFGENVSSAVLSKGVLI